RAVEVDGVDLVERDEPLDVDRAGGVLPLDRLQIRVVDDHELPFRQLPAPHDLVALDLALVHRAPAAVLDRRLALGVQLPERDVGGARRRLRRRRQPDGNRDQAEADRSVPGRPHRGTWNSRRGPRYLPRTTLRAVAATRTIGALWRDAVARASTRPPELGERDGAWVEVSWPEGAGRVDDLANGLLALGVKKGDAFSIFASTSLEWCLFDFALGLIGAIGAPVYANSSARDAAYVL